MQREREHTARRRRVEHADALCAGGVRDQLSLAPRAGVGETGDQRAQRVVGYGEQHEIRRRDHFVGREDLGVRQHALDAGA